jgi:hypothetical protein
MARIREAVGAAVVACSMECAENYPEPRDPGDMRRFDRTMTDRLNSNVPIPYVDF